MRQARQQMLQDRKNSACRSCYLEEQHGGTSRRLRANQKSVIFTRENFHDSYQQSPHYHKFEQSRSNQGQYDGLPVDIHIDLGNYCNLTCKMCRPQASSSIADQYRRWGITGAEQFIGTDWTRDTDTWRRTLDELAAIRPLRNVHFMGGETLITPRFEQFLDHMLAQGRNDLSFSFVTNGTQFRPRLLEKLRKFQRVGIEVSLETVTNRNAYQRQGTDTQQVLSNIQRYLTYCNGHSWTLTLRPAVSALTIGHYHTLLQFALDHKLIVKSLIVMRPEYLAASILPDPVKQQYLRQFQDFIVQNNLQDQNYRADYNASDPNEIKRIVANQVAQCESVLQQQRPANADLLLTEMVHWCAKWDRVHGFDAVKIYPELIDVFRSNGYHSA